MTGDSTTARIQNRARDALRSDIYALLAALLAQPPTSDRLAQLENLETLPGIPVALGCGLNDLKLAAGQAEAQKTAREYDRLFLGPGCGLVMPYGSWYGEGMLMGAPLARLRQDLIEIGIRRCGNTSEPEDHAAALCETMVLLLAESTLSPAQAADFFLKHVASWMPRFFEDLETCGTANFYRIVGSLGKAFMQLESEWIHDQMNKEE